MKKKVPRTGGIWCMCDFIGELSDESESISGVAWDAELDAEKCRCYKYDARLPGGVGGRPFLNVDYVNLKRKAKR